MLRRRGHPEPLEYLPQLPLKQLEFGDLLLDGTQLLRHGGAQLGAYAQTLPALEISRQRFESGKGEP